MHNFPLVQITWQDSVSSDPWQEIGAAIEEATTDQMLHYSAGYLLLNDKNCVLLGGSVRAEGDVTCNTIQIPKGAVLSIVPLRPVP